MAEVGTSNTSPSCPTVDRDTWEREGRVGNSWGIGEESWGSSFGRLGTVGESWGSSIGERREVFFLFFLPFINIIKHTYKKVLKLCVRNLHNPNTSHI